MCQSLYRYSKNNEGSIAILTGLGLFAFIAFVSLAVNVERAYRLQNDMNQASTIGSLAGAITMALEDEKKPDDAKIREIADKYYQANIDDVAKRERGDWTAELSPDQILINREERTVSLDPDGSLPTYFTSGERMQVAAPATAIAPEREFPDLEVALAFDVTTSMVMSQNGGQSSLTKAGMGAESNVGRVTYNPRKLEDAKKAATMLVNKLYEKKRKNHELYISVIPFSSTVRLNVEGAPAYENWIDRESLERVNWASEVEQAGKKGWKGCLINNWPTNRDATPDASDTTPKNLALIPHHYQAPVVDAVNNVPALAINPNVAYYSTAPRQYTYTWDPARTVAAKRAELLKDFTIFVERGDSVAIPAPPSPPSGGGGGGNNGGGGYNGPPPPPVQAMDTVGIGGIPAARGLSPVPALQGGRPGTGINNLGDGNGDGNGNGGGRGKGGGGGMGNPGEYAGGSAAPVEPGAWTGTGGGSGKGRGSGDGVGDGIGSWDCVNGAGPSGGKAKARSGGGGGGGGGGTNGYGSGYGSGDGYAEAEGDGFSKGGKGCEDNPGKNTAMPSTAKTPTAAGKNGQPNGASTMPNGPRNTAGRSPSASGKPKLEGIKIGPSNDLSAPQDYCYLPPIKPLSADRGAVLQHIASFGIDREILNAQANTGVAGTIGQFGMLWAWRTLSPNWQGLWSIDKTPNERPAMYGADDKRKGKQTFKSIIFLSDGVGEMPEHYGAYGNTPATTQPSKAMPDPNVFYNRASNKMGTALDPFWKRYDWASHGLKSTTFEQADNELDTKLLGVCSRIKKESPITIFTIGFDIKTGGKRATELLTQCASKPEFAFLADSGEDLEKAFNDIVEKMAELKIRVVQ